MINLTDFLAYLPKNLNTANDIVLTPHFSNSGGTKAALRNMTHTLAMEWATHGIRVNSISPGFVRTQMTAKIEAAPDFQTKMKVSVIVSCSSIPSRASGQNSICQSTIP
jgi:NAD(P)-dependent dehydrogenase (short-subunit alcohol dehydrogenase family)